MEAPKKFQETPFGLTKVYCDFLPKSNDGLQDRVEKFFNCGKIIKMLKKNGKTNGYFVFRKPNSVRAALRKDMDDFEGKRIRVEVPRGLTAETQSKDEPKRKINFKDRKEIMKSLPQRQVYLSHLSKPVNQDIIKSLIDERLPHLSEAFEGVKMMGEKNCCFVTFKNHSEVQEFCSVFDGFPLLGQNLVAVPAEAPGVMKGNPATEDAEPEEEETKSDKKPTPVIASSKCLQVLVGILPNDVKVTDVRSAFTSSCGKVLDTKLIRNKNTGVFTGVASVKFERLEGVKKALSMSGETITLGRPVEISVELDDNSEPPTEEAKPVVVKKQKRRNTVLVVQELKPIVKSSSPSKTKRKLAQRESVKKQKLAPLPTRSGGDDSDLEIASNDEDQNVNKNDHKKKRMTKVATPVNNDDDDDDDDFEVVAKAQPVMEKKRTKKIKRRSVCHV